MHAERPEHELVSELQSLAEHLAHSLTFCKCKSDLQVHIACLLYRLGDISQLGGHVSFHVPCTFIIPYAGMHLWMGRSTT